MPENQDPDNDQGDGSVGNSTIQAMRKQIKDLEEKAKAADSLTAERDALTAQLAGFQKSAAFDRLNIPPTGSGKLFRDTYQGELTDEAIIAKASEYGVVQAPQPQTAQPTIPGIDQDAWARQQAALQGTASSTPATAMDALKTAATPEALLDTLRELGLMDASQG